MTNKKTGLFKSFLKTTAFKLLVIVFAWQMALLLIGNLLELADPNSASTSGLLAHTLRWDSGWLSEITSHFYKGNPASAAFYPLFPLLVRFLHIISLGLLTYAAAGLLINIAASYFAVYGLYKIGCVLLRSQGASVYGSLLFLTFPTAFFMHGFYTEAIFCAVAFWAYYFALKRRWLLMGVLLALLTACRLPGILFVGLCGLEYLRSKNWQLKGTDKNALYFLLAPVGFVAYGLYLYWLQGDFFGMFSAYKATNDWAYQVINPNVVITIVHPFKNTLSLLLGRAPLSIGAFNYNVMPAMGLLLVTASSIYALVKIKKWAVPLGIFSIASVLLFTINNNVVSLQRYALPCLIMYLVGGYLYDTYRKSSWVWLFYVIPGIFLMLQVALFILFIFGWFVG